MKKDHQLVKRCLRQDQKAQFELYERFQTKMFGLCLRYAGTESEALDFLQEGFLTVFIRTRMALYLHPKQPEDD